MTNLNNTSCTKPVVLCFSGHDPSGGAGIQADIEAIAAQGAHAVTVITALTCQDSSHVHSFKALDATQLQHQAETLFNDMSIAAIKIGMTASVEVVVAISNIIKQHSDIAVIFDPVLASGGGDDLSANDLVTAINSHLVPYCDLITPNIPEALKLTNQLADQAADITDNIELAANALLSAGCKSVLVTGTHSDTDKITHRLFQAKQMQEDFHNSRLPDEYHGSGCTLASSIAGLIARGNNSRDAIRQALDYTFQSLQYSHNPGKGQRFPNRLYNTDSKSS